MYSECDDCSGRRNYGPNPWSAPGTARAVDFVMGGSGGNMLGVCGASPSRDNDYNTPLDGHWGMSAKTTYNAGDVIEVEWCVSARDRREHHKFSHPDTHSSISHRRTTAECLSFASATTKAS